MTGECYALTSAPFEGATQESWYLYKPVWYYHPMGSLSWHQIRAGVEPVFVGGRPGPGSGSGIGKIPPHTEAWIRVQRFGDRWSCTHWTMTWEKPEPGPCPECGMHLWAKQEIHACEEYAAENAARAAEQEQAT